MKKNILKTILAGTIILSMQTAVFADEIPDNQDEFLLAPQILVEEETSESPEILEEVVVIPELPQEVWATYNTSTIEVNREVIPFGSFSIGYSTYVSLDDLAYTLAGTASRFDVITEEDVGQFHLDFGQNYVAPNYLYNYVEKVDQTGYLSPVPMVFGAEKETVHLSAYIIDEITYVKLSEMSQLLDFYLAWDSEASKVVIQTTVFG